MDVLTHLFMSIWFLGIGLILTSLAALIPIYWYITIFKSRQGISNIAVSIVTLVIFLYVSYVSGGSGLRFLRESWEFLAMI